MYADQMFADHNFENLLRTLIRCPSVVGAEHAFFRELERELEHRGIQTHRYEGLLVAQGRRPDSVMFSAHIDRHGLICTGPNEFQYAAFCAGNRSDLLGNSVSEQMMLKVASRFENERVYAFDSHSGTYRGTGSIQEASICDRRNNLIFEVDGLKHADVGTPVAFVDQLSKQNGKYSAQLDNVLTAAALLHLFSLGFEGTAFFTAQEEIGKSWRYLLEWFRRYDYDTNHLIVLDTSPFAAEDVEKHQIVLRRKDANASFHEGTTDKLQSLCETEGVSYLFKDSFVEQQNVARAAEGQKLYSLGSTELGRIIAASDGRITGTTVQIPTTSYHTVNETATISACDDFIRILKAISNAS